MVLFNTQKSKLINQFTKGMWFEEQGMTKVLFDTQLNDLKYQFTRSMWFKGLGITKVLC